MRMLFVAVLACAAAPCFAADWNPGLAAGYLDGRQKEWFAWPAAKTVGGPCISCHTGVTYMLVRPSLRRALGEATPTSYETGLLDAVKARVTIHDPLQLSVGGKEPKASQALGVETIVSTLFLASNDAGRTTLSADTEKAFERLWALQQTDGDSKGSWHWNSLNYDPWEMPDSEFFGASLAALAVGTAPADYQSRPAIHENVAALRQYLRTHEEAQPLHNRLLFLWASTKLRDSLSDARRRAILDDVWSKQQPDGGWTLEALGPWKQRTTAPPASGSNAYATGLVTLVVEKSGAERKHAGLVKALDWLRSHQNPESGFWDASSMNKTYAPDSMQVKFMRDAATGYATLALLEAGK
jgi:squalene-hopene/tetraprenyl-beta-curcumene cyclase